jgi:hypothetical protein
VFFSTLVMILCSASIFAQQKYVVVTAIKANIRETPSLQAKIVGTVKQSNLLPVYANEGKWYYITVGKIRGWIHYTTIRVANDADFPKLSKFEIKKKSKTKSYRNIYKDEWLFVSETNVNKLYYNPSTMEKTGEIVAVWTKAIKLNTYDMHYLEINCIKREFRILLSLSYNLSGDVTKSNDFKSYTAFDEIVPDSAMEITSESVCEATK